MQTPTDRIYHPRNPERSPFFKVVDRYFDQFERIYPQKYESTYGFWRPVIHDSVEKFRKCGDLKQGFARIKCDDCGHEMFVPFSCHQRCSCPTCHQKRSLLLSVHLTDDVLAEVPHRQFVFTIPKRLRLYFRYNRELLGELVHAAWETVSEIYSEEVAVGEVFPAMIAGIQTFGDLINWHPHIHAIVPEGVFLSSGTFCPIDTVTDEMFCNRWQEKVFRFLKKAGLIDDEVIDSMKSWKFSGFSVNRDVRIEAGDKAGMMRLIQYIARCPFSLERMISVTPEGKVLYRAGKGKCYAFPKQADPKLTAGIKRNFEVFEPLDFLAEVTQHVPLHGQHQVRMFGWYSHKKIGQRRKAHENASESSKIDGKSVATWAMLIKLIFEIDPFVCPKCGGNMKIISIIDRKQSEVVEKILRHCHLWNDPDPPPKPSPIPEPEFVESITCDDHFFDMIA